MARQWPCELEQRVAAMSFGPNISVDTRSRCESPRNAIAAAAAVAWSNLVQRAARPVCVPPQPSLLPSVPKRMLPEESTMTWMSRFVSCWKRLRYSLSLRPNTFQSMCRTGSPATYWRCSANSTASPW